jgi:Na+-driven multidrug efflux pump
MGLSGVGLGAPCASLVAFVIGLIYYLSGKWKVNRIIQHKN